MYLIFLSSSGENPVSGLTTSPLKATLASAEWELPTKPSNLLIIEFIVLLFAFILVVISCISTCMLLNFFLISLWVSKIDFIVSALFRCSSLDGSVFVTFGGCAGAGERFSVPLGTKAYTSVLTTKWRS